MNKIKLIKQEIEKIEKEISYYEERIFISEMNLGNLRKDLYDFEEME